jgi:hypothetical protein
MLAPTSKISAMRRSGSARFRSCETLTPRRAEEMQADGPEGALHGRLGQSLSVPREGPQLELPVVRGIGRRAGRRSGGLRIVLERDHGAVGQRGGLIEVFHARMRPEILEGPW